MTENDRDKIRVIVCRADERAEIIEIEDKLEAMQEEEKYKEKFDLPEMFMMDGGEIETIKYDPDGKNNPRTAINARGEAQRDFAR